MTEVETEQLKKQQSRALDVSAPTGATIKHNHLQRTQDLLPMTRDDLEDIKGFDGLQTFFFGFGMFLFSGASWLALEKLYEAETLSMTPLLSVCLVSVGFGLICFVVGLVMRGRKIGKINRIISQTRPR